MVRYYVPNLLVPLQEHIKPVNAHAADLQNYYRDWISSSTWFSPQDKKRWIAVDLHIVISRTLPDASADQLRTFLDGLMLTIALEQMTDKPASSEEVDKWVGIYIAALNQEPIEDERPFAKIIQELASKTLSKVDENYKAQFIAGNVAFARGVSEEAAARERTMGGYAHATIADYMKVRQKTIGVSQFFGLTRCFWNLDLLDSVSTHPVFIEMETMAIQMIALANDIYSYKMERMGNDLDQNAVAIAMHDPTTSVADGDLQAALDHIGERFALTAARFFKLKADVLAIVPEENKALYSQVHFYAEFAINITIGVIRFSLASRRYQICLPSEGTEMERIIFDID